MYNQHCIFASVLVLYNKMFIKILENEKSIDN